jgi:transcriptional regulator with XRE-family HTH domain
MGARMPNIGDTLREARMRQHLDIADVESKTKIRAKYLRALENEEFGMLPGPTFVKTFLRTYAEALGLDPQVLVEEYRATYESREEAEHLQPLGPTAVARERRRGPGPPRGPWVAIGLVVVLVVGALLLIGLIGGDEEGGGGGGGGSEQAGNERTTETTPTTKTEPEKPAPPKRVTLRITPNNPVYVCLDTGPETDVTFEGILDAPRTFRGRRLRVNLGKTDVQVTVNGKPVQIEPGPDPVGFAFTPSSQRSLPVGERPCA